MLNFVKGKGRHSRDRRSTREPKPSRAWIHSQGPTVITHQYDHARTLPGVFINKREPTRYDPAKDGYRRTAPWYFHIDIIHCHPDPKSEKAFKHDYPGVLARRKERCRLGISERVLRAKGPEERAAFEEALRLHP